MRKGAAIAAIAVTLAITGCGDSGRDEVPRGESTPITTIGGETEAAATTTSTARGVLTPTETGLSTNTGIETMILSVEEAQSRYGLVTVFTFQLVNTGDKIFEGYNWPSPVVVYGPAGSPAEHTFSLSEGYGEGVQGSIPPGMRQTVQHAYAVSKAELNPAVVTVGSLVWQGDFSTFTR